MSDDFKFQLSVKIDGSHLLNIRAGSSLEFFEEIKEAVESAELIASACRALEGATKPQQAPPVVATRQGAVGVPAASYKPPVASGEIGPVLLKSVKKDLYNRENVEMKSPKYTVEFGNGKTLSTFKKIWGEAAETLAGKMVYYTTETNGKYVNLAEVRGA